MAMLEDYLPECQRNLEPFKKKINYLNKNEFKKIPLFDEDP